MVAHLDKLCLAYCHWMSPQQMIERIPDQWNISANKYLMEKKSGKHYELGLYCHNTSSLLIFDILSACLLFIIIISKYLQQTVNIPSSNSHQTRNIFSSYPHNISNFLLIHWLTRDKQWRRWWEVRQLARVLKMAQTVRNENLSFWYSCSVHGTTVRIFTLICLWRSKTTLDIKWALGLHVKEKIDSCTYELPNQKWFSHCYSTDYLDSSVQFCQNHRRHTCKLRDKSTNETTNSANQRATYS